MVIQAIRSKVSMVSPFGLIIEECRKGCSSFNKCVLFFIRRSANMAAHFLAKEAYSFPGREIDGRNVPVNLKTILLADLP